MHTLIDTGLPRYRNQIFSLLNSNGVYPSSIERIIITHRHPDHWGLAGLLARESKAKILVHPNFKNFIEEQSREEESWWSTGFDPTELQSQDIEYLAQGDESNARTIGEVDFPQLGEPIEIGVSGKLEILACPKSNFQHSPDQIIVLYSHIARRQACENGRQVSLPTDNILFSGDLWLMRGPLYDSPFKEASLHFKYWFNQIRRLMLGRSMLRLEVPEQDLRAKEALKRGFSAIRVKPGHGEEFLGSRIIPISLLAERDLLRELGCSISTDKSILKGKEFSPKAERLMERAYFNFVEELVVWSKYGYSPEEISWLLVRIYREQGGGFGEVKKDRKERRIRLKSILTRLKVDRDQTKAIRLLAKSTLKRI